MKSLNWSYFAVIISVISNVGCIPSDIEDEEGLISRNGIPGALNYLIRDFPKNMTLDDRCEMYAVLLSQIDRKHRTHRRAVSQVLAMKKDEVKEHYERLPRDALTELYMNGIDNYRSAASLAPPFLELVECLRRLGGPVIDFYLRNPELIIIMDFYKQILANPESKINMTSMNLDVFQPTFVESLRYIFGKHLENLKYRHSDLTTTGSTHYIHHYKSSYRHREHERLRKQRIRILRPDLELAKERKRARRRRILRQQRQKGTVGEKVLPKLHHGAKDRWRPLQIGASAIKVLDSSSSQDQGQSNSQSHSQSHSRSSESTNPSDAPEKHQAVQVLTMTDVPSTSYRPVVYILDTSSSHHLDQQQSSGNRRKQPTHVLTMSELLPAPIAAQPVTNIPAYDDLNRMYAPEKQSSGSFEVESAYAPVTTQVMSTREPEYVSTFEDLMPSTAFPHRVSTSDLHTVSQTHFKSEERFCIVDCGQNYLP